MNSETKSIKLPTGVTLQYVEQGALSGVPVLFLHGLSDSWHSFELVLPHLPESIHAFALTQRGHADSSHPDTAYHFHNFAEDVTAFMDALQLKAAVVVGHSMGSTIAQRFAIEKPERSKGLVLIASFLSLPNSEAPRQLWEILSEMEDPVDQNFVREFQESTISQPVPQEFLEKAVMEESMKIPARVWKEVVRCSMEDDFSSELTKIKAPTLLIWGDQDTMVSRSEQDAQLKAIPDSRLLVYGGHGHAIHWEAPERFASDLVKFIETKVR